MKKKCQSQKRNGLGFFKDNTVKNRIYIKGKIKHFVYSFLCFWKIKKYFKTIKNNPPKKVIYTCTTGDYDYINVNMFINPQYKYVCFTDTQRDIDKKTIGVWEIRPLAFSKLDNQKNNRYHKFFPNELFPQFEESIYVDTNVLAKTSKLFDLADELHNKKDIFIAIPPHKSRNCIYKEIDKCLKSLRDKPETLEKHRNFLQSEGFPKNLGLTENNVIYRKHNDERCIKVMQEWWEMLAIYSKRDQLSLFYVLWKNGFEMTLLSDKAIKTDKKNFFLNHHQR